MERLTPEQFHPVDRCPRCGNELDLPPPPRQLLRLPRWILPDVSSRTSSRRSSVEQPSAVDHSPVTVDQNLVAESHKQEGSVASIRDVRMKAVEYGRYPVKRVVVPIPSKPSHESKLSVHVKRKSR